MRTDRYSIYCTLAFYLLAILAFATVLYASTEGWLPSPYYAYNFTGGNQCGRLFRDEGNFYITGVKCALPAPPTVQAQWLKDSNNISKVAAVGEDGNLYLQGSVHTRATTDTFETLWETNKIEVQFCKPGTSGLENIIAVTTKSKVGGNLYLRGDLVTNRKLVSEVDTLVVLVNHVGYTTAGKKTCMMKGPVNQAYTYTVVNNLTGARLKKTMVVYPDTELSKAGQDRYQVGDFSFDVQTPGVYHIEVNKGLKVISSVSFRIADDVYDDAIHKMIRYFSMQRCGNTTTGWHGPCHQSDGIIHPDFIPSSPQHDATGGWHDACDVLKFTNEHASAVVALEEVDSLMKPVYDRADIYGDLKWGNKFCLNMQAPDYNFIFWAIGPNDARRDNNYWSNGRLGSSGVRDIMVYFPNNEWDSIYAYDDSNNTREELQRQQRFIEAEAAAALFAIKVHDSYGHDTAQAAFERQLGTNQNRYFPIERTLDYCYAIRGLLRAYEDANNTNYLTAAAGYANTLVTYQNTSAKFFNWAGSNEPIGMDNYIVPLLTLSEVISRSPSPNPDWKTCMKSYLDSFLINIARRNAFQIVPGGMYSKNFGWYPIMGGRRLDRSNPSDPYFYRYFPIDACSLANGKYSTSLGCNRTLAFAAIGLIKAAKIFKQYGDQAEADSCILYGQRQLDWIMGCNPYNMSMIEAVGYNQTYRYVSDHILTPLLPGAVMNGIACGGIKENGYADIPYVFDYIYGGSNGYIALLPDQYKHRNSNVPSCEYWTIQQEFTLWALAEMRSLAIPDVSKDARPFYYPIIYYNQ